MQKQIVIIVAIACLASTISAQSDSTGGNFWKPNPGNYEVKQAFEVESLVPMFFTGGFHFAVGYRYLKLRVRVSVINGGSYNVDNQAVGKTDEGYRRYYTTSPGFFLGYNVWKNLEVYGYYERHTFEIEQIETGEKQDLPSNDFGLGSQLPVFYRPYFLYTARYSYLFQI